MQTKNGIELNLKESKYKAHYNNLVFYFSSEFYKNKFQNEIVDFIKIETIKLFNKYKTSIELTDYLSISLYRKIEKRGFYITLNETIVLPKDVEFKIEII